MAFTTLVLTNVGLILVNRSFSSSLWGALSGRNPALWVVMAVVVPLLAIAVTWTGVQHLFGFGPLHMDDLAIGLGAAILLLMGLEAAKRLWHMRLVT